MLRQLFFRMSKTCTTEQAANYLGISQARVRQFILEERLKAQKFGRDYMIAFNELMKFAKIGRKRSGRPTKQVLRKRNS
jgi:site-specific DNA-methyltransferase (cytosine-N4-specific)